DAAYDAFIAFHTANLVEGTTLYPGAAAALEDLRAQGATLAVCTNKPSVLARGVLAALGVTDRFASIVGGDTFPTRKPDPAVLIGCLREAGGDPERAVMVGDSHTDVETARRAGIPVIAVEFGYSDKPVVEFGPDRTIAHFAELPPTVVDLLDRALT